MTTGEGATNLLILTATPSARVHTLSIGCIGIGAKQTWGTGHAWTWVVHPNLCGCMDHPPCGVGDTPEPAFKLDGCNGIDRTKNMSHVFSNDSQLVFPITLVFVIAAFWHTHAPPMPHRCIPN